MALPDKKRPFRVLLVDDHPIVRAAVRAHLAQESDLEVVGEASDARSALELAESGVDVVLVDLELDHEWGMDLLLALRGRFPALRVLVFTAHDDPMLAQRALDLGALGYVVKTAEPALLVDALRTVARGEVFLGPSITAHLVRRWRERSPRALTDRELEIFRMIGRGRETKEIAATLGLSVKTVETHRARIRAKLGIRGVGELIVRAALFVRGGEP